ncbi:hypothetical protein FRX31_032951 [Thalictrum thalictroides]|uniref:Uncharacterized protein n=1 Tax=Thalictrum thalictroides TaxID=46969 RepID=A0A7J6UZ56_THATH|nr:hypothetical protein FRX31_032951 [Thalictrum thalictroides]
MGRIFDDFFGFPVFLSRFTMTYPTDHTGKEGFLPGPSSIPSFASLFKNLNPKTIDLTPATFRAFKNKKDQGWETSHLFQGSISRDWNVAGNFTMGILDPRDVLVRFDSEAEVTKALSRPICDCMEETPYEHQEDEEPTPILPDCQLEQSPAIIPALAHLSLINNESLAVILHTSILDSESEEEELEDYGDKAIISYCSDTEITRKKKSVPPLTMVTRKMAKLSRVVNLPNFTTNGDNSGKDWVFWEDSFNVTKISESDQVIAIALTSDQNITIQPTYNARLFSLLF